MANKRFVVEGNPDFINNKDEKLYLGKGQPICFNSVLSTITMISVLLQEMLELR